MKDANSNRGGNSVHPAMTWLACVAWLTLAGWSAEAATKSWSNSAGGDYTNAANWNGGVPGSSDCADFEKTNVYTINLTTSVTNDNLYFIANNGVAYTTGTVTFNFNSNSLTLLAAADGYGNRYPWTMSEWGGTNIVNMNNGTLVLPRGACRIGASARNSLGVGVVNCSNMTFIGDSFQVAYIDGGWVGHGSWNLYNSTATLSNFSLANAGGAGNTFSNGTGNVLIGPGSVLSVVNGFSVGAYGSNVVGTITISNGTLNANGGFTLGVGSPGVCTSGDTGNLIVQGNGAVYANGAVLLGYADTACGNIIIQDNGRVYVNGTVGFGYYSSAAYGSVVLNGPNALLEVNTLTVNNNHPSTVRNNGGIYQYTSASPAITPGTFGNFSISNGTVSFRAITNADVTCNLGTKALRSDTVMLWAGTSNTFRLNNATNGGTPNQAYTFAPGTATNFARLELVNGSTYRNGNVTLGAGGSLYVSGGASTISSVLTAAPSSTIEFDLSNTHASGCLLSTTNMYLNGCTLKLDFANPPIVNTPFLIISNAVAGQLSYSFAGGSTWQACTINGTNYVTTINRAGGGREVVVQTVIPANGNVFHFN